ncbi:S8 family peptidase [Streptomyces yaizuensis]|uniref:S8 family serine peptidase n=1 Tax=Streptomyces yaizuensis TaxID=2989713 RepID=A0ABQ5NYM8_9ACTN|nr:S8 family peptidase [Streptomyces sp. YSPA8]GLF95470.1 S8 family serine peptidase [Streptomyces sp. YSPA8]
MFSRKHSYRGGATLTTAVAAALVAGLTTPAASASAGPLGGTAGAVAFGAGAALMDRGGTAGGGGAAGLHWVTLITGDRVGVDAQGRAAALDRAEGRSGIPVQTFTQDGSTYVVPADARSLIAAGRLDRRLFDITELSRAESRAAYREGLKVIVAYDGAPGATARKGLRTAGDVRVGRTLPVLNADAVTIPGREASALWDSLTRTGGGTDARTTTVSGVRHIWLDRVYSAKLDKSVARIGAPQVWRAGFDGTGVKVAVLDTGVDRTHPDLTTQVVAEKNFTDAKDVKDRHGHGTHVASTVAGTGARSGGTHKGVAPGARIISSKVLNDRGSGTASSIIGGIDWAVAQGADVINMSLGAPDGPEIDPVEAQVNKVFQEKGVLFAVGAGNEGRRGPTGSISSPGSADGALTVGAVDDDGATAPFSSRGPRADGGAIKPDVAAPGVDIVAAAAAGTEVDPQAPAGYATQSGTSMATPHVAGAAALLKQRHPGWTGDRLKSALTASTEDLGRPAVEQGTGRIALERAIGQSVVADPSSVSFAQQSWPHHDDTPQTRKITYRNLGDTDITLDVKATGYGPKGRPAPAGFFTLGTGRVTVPAGGTASVDLSVDTRIGGTADGYYSASVVATGGGQSVRTVAGVEREPERYDLTIKYIGRDGKPTRNLSSMLYGLFEDGGSYMFDDEASSVTIRLLRGEYALSSSGAVDPRNYAKGYDLLIQPRLSLTRNTTVTVDARKAKPVSITVPDRKAKLSRAVLGYAVGKGAHRSNDGFFFDSLTNVRTAHLGPEATAGSFAESWTTRWKPVGPTEYTTVTGGPAKKYSTGYTKKFKAGDFATVKVGTASSVKGKYGYLTLASELGGITSYLDGGPQPLPGVRNLAVASGPGATWSLESVQSRAKVPDPWGDEVRTFTPSKVYRPGRTYTETIGTGVHSPLVRKDISGAYREGGRIYGDVALFSDGKGQPAYSHHASAKTTLHRGTTKIGETKDPISASNPFEVGADRAVYTLATSVRRDKKITRTAVRIDAAWTFTSQQPAKGTVDTLPLSSVRLDAKPALDNTVPAGRQATIPVTVEGPAAGKGLKSLTVSVSYDGTSWKKVTVTRGKITVKNPAKGKSISFRAQIVDTKDNRSTITVHDAYHGT